MQYPIKVVLKSGSAIHVTASRETIESFGDVNILVDKMIKPLEDVYRIEVELHCKELDDSFTEVTYYSELEPWVNTGEYMVVTYNFEGRLEEDRGMIERQDSWLPKYLIVSIRGRGSKYVNTLITEDVALIRTRKEHKKMYDRIRGELYRRFGTSAKFINRMSINEAERLLNDMRGKNASAQRTYNIRNLGNQCKHLLEWSDVAE